MLEASTSPALKSGARSWVQAIKTRLTNRLRPLRSTTI
jgi:hypothetical protein